jgi:hypothetical protein
MADGNRSFLAESLLIVVSILIAFWIDAWWEERQDRRQEQRVLEALRAEFDTNATKLPSYIDSHLQVAEIIERTLNGLDQDSDKIGVRVPDHELAWILSHVSTDPQRGALDAILQSGELRFIQSRELRERLAGWPQLVVDATENEELLRKIWSPEFNRLLGEQVDTLPLQHLDDCTVAPAYDPAGCEAKYTFTIRSDPRLNIVMIQVYQWSLEAARELEVLRQEAMVMVEVIDRELASSRF